MSVFATILDAEYDFADWMFLIGTVLAFIAAVVSIPNLAPRLAAWAMTLVGLALCALALGFLAL